MIEQAEERAYQRVLRDARRNGPLRQSLYTGLKQEPKPWLMPGLLPFEMEEVSYQISGIKSLQFEGLFGVIPLIGGGDESFVVLSLKSRRLILMPASIGTEERLLGCKGSYLCLPTDPLKEALSARC